MQARSGFNIVLLAILFLWQILYFSKSAVAQNPLPDTSFYKPYTPEKGEVFTIIDEQPSFKGGEIALSKYLIANIKYPRKAKKAGIQGVVYVEFCVDVDGRIREVIILSGIGGGCDEEAARVVKKMPKWNPGRQRGKAIKVKYFMPIKFTLAG